MQENSTWRSVNTSFYADGLWTTVRYTQNHLGWESPLIKLKIKNLQSNQKLVSVVSVG